MGPSRLALPPSDRPPTGGSDDQTCPSTRPPCLLPGIHARRGPSPETLPLVSDLDRRLDLGPSPSSRSPPPQALLSEAGAPAPDLGAAGDSGWRTKRHRRDLRGGFDGVSLNPPSVPSLSRFRSWPSGSVRHRDLLCVRSCGRSRERPYISDGRLELFRTSLGLRVDDRKRRKSVRLRLGGLLFFLWGG